LPDIGAGFAAAAGLLLAAEGTADLRTARPDVDVGDATVAADIRDEGLGFAHVASENARRKSLGNVVVQGHGLVEVAVAHHIEDRGEGLVLDQVVLSLDLD